jgi:pimeloyl-ACP methyl ester carboxylesterase
VRYLDAGNGDPVLLLHGIGHSIRAWGRTMPALAEAGFRALAIDTPGFGFSEQPPSIWGEEDLVSFLDEFLDTFYLDQATVAGHSLGGAFATVYALHRPERVKKLVLAAAAVGPDVSPALRLLTLQVAQPLLRPLALRQVFGLLAGSWDEEVLEQEVKDATRWLSDPEARVYFWNVLRLGLRARGVKPEYLLLERLRELKMPVLVAWGEKDLILPVSNVDKIRQVLPDARYEIFPEAGHMITYEAPERFNAALIDFLRDS